MKYVAYLTILLAAHSVGTRADATVLTDVDLFVGQNFDPNSPDPSPQYRIPSIIQTADGSLLAFIQARIGPADPGRQPGGQEIHLKRSTDNGATWSPVNLLVSDLPQGPLFDYNGFSPVNLNTGNLGFFYGQWVDASNPRVSEQFWTTSNDGGLTFAPAVNITSQIQDPSWQELDAGPGRGIQLRWQTDPSRNGRIILSGKRALTFDSFAAVSIYSDDDGSTWTTGAVTTGPRGGGNENEVVELTNGQLLMDARQTGSNRRDRWTSNDGGETWTQSDQSDFFITTVDGSMIRYSAARSGDDRDRLLFSGPLGTNTDPNDSSGKNRNNMAVWTSYDEGQTFINPVQLNEGPGGYSALERLNDGTITILYERPANNKIAFTRFDLSHLEGASHPAAMSHYDGFGNPVDALRGGVGWTGAWTPTGNVTVASGPLEFPGFFTAGDDQHIRLVNGGEMMRDLGVGTLDLNQNQDYYVSMFVEKESDGSNGGNNNFFSVRFDESGGRQFAIGVDTSDTFFVGNTSPSSNVPSSNSAVVDDRYLLLAKIVAQDDSNGSNFDQIFLAAFDSVLDLPANDEEISWMVAGSMADNFSGSIDSLFIRTGDNGDWRVDGLRIGTTFDSVIVDTGVGPPPVLGDLNSDLLVNTVDWIEFKAKFQMDTSSLTADLQLREGDFDNSGLIGLEDFIAFVDLYDAANGIGAFAALGTTVPEPSTAMLLGFVVTFWGLTSRSFAVVNGNADG